MIEEKSTQKQVRLNAPTYMRPKSTVMDAPLDIDAGKNVVQRPITRMLRKETVVESAVTIEETQVVETIAAVEEITVEEVSVVAEEALVVEEVPQGSTEEPSAYEFTTTQDTDPVIEDTVETEEEMTRSRKGMTVFQQFIVFLLLLVVALFLVTIYLYINGWIELPQVVLNAVEKILALIP